MSEMDGDAAEKSRDTADLRPLARRWGWGRTASTLALQLVVVFVGVYAAFLLEDYREEREIERLNEQLYVLLIGEVESVASGLDQQRAEFDSLYLAPLMGEPEARHAPRPYLDVKGDMRSPELQALLESGSLAADDPALLPVIRRYNANLGYVVKLSDEFRRYNIEHVVPVLEAGSESFYDEGGAPRPQYRVYGRLALQLRMGMVEAVREAEQLSALLRSWTGGGRTPSDGRALARSSSFVTRRSPHAPATRAMSHAQPTAA
jgi:hypothetical protein